MAVYNPPRTYTGKWFGTWFGGTAYNWFGPFPTGRGVIIERAACECCYGTCRCSNCMDFGYWDEYEVTIPVPYGYQSPWTTGNTGTSAGYAYFLLTGPRTFTMPILYNNNAEVGSCCAVYEESDIEFTHGGTDYTIDHLLVSFCPDWQGSGDNVLTVEVTEEWLQFPGLYVVLDYKWTSTYTSAEDCLADSLVLTATEGQVFGPRQYLDWYDGPTNPPPVPKTVTVTPAAGAVWKSCGTDEDGDPITDPGGPGAGPAANLFDSVSVGGNKLVVKKRTALPAVRPDRCEHIGRRTENRFGCNGWTCRHSCDLGLPAVPGKYCQTCDKYEADPDYVGQGVSGWLK